MADGAPTLPSNAAGVFFPFDQLWGAAQAADAARLEAERLQAEREAAVAAAAAAGTVHVVRCATTTVSDPQLAGVRPAAAFLLGAVVDGVALAPGDRVLCTHLVGTAAVFNGVWVVGATGGAAPTRPSTTTAALGAANTIVQLPYANAVGMEVHVVEGAVNAAATFVCIAVSAANGAVFQPTVDPSPDADPAAPPVRLVRCAATPATGPAVPAPSPSLTVGAVVDGVVCAAGDRVLLAYGGPTAGLWTCGDAAQTKPDPVVVGTVVCATAGDANADAAFVCVDPVAGVYRAIVDPTPVAKPVGLGLHDLTDAAHLDANRTVALGCRPAGALLGGTHNLFVGADAAPAAPETNTGCTVVGAYQLPADAVNRVVLADGSGGGGTGVVLAAAPAAGTAVLGGAADLLAGAGATVAAANCTWLGGRAAADATLAGHDDAVVIATGAGAGLLAGRTGTAAGGGAVWCGPGCKRLFSDLAAAVPTGAAVLAAAGGPALYADPDRLWLGRTAADGGAAAVPLPPVAPALRGVDPAAVGVARHGVWIGATAPATGAVAGPVTLADPGLARPRWHCDPAGRVSWSVPPIGAAIDDAAAPAADDTLTLAVDQAAAGAPAYATLRLRRPGGGGLLVCPVGRFWDPAVLAAVRPTGPSAAFRWDASVAASLRTRANAVPTGGGSESIMCWTEVSRSPDDWTPGNTNPAFPFNAFAVPASLTVQYSPIAAFKMPALLFTSVPTALVYPYYEFRRNAELRNDGQNGGRLPPPQLAQTTAYAVVMPQWFIPPPTGTFVETVACKGLLVSVNAAFRVAFELVRVRDEAKVYPRITVSDSTGGNVAQLQNPTGIGESAAAVVCYRVAWDRLSIFVDGVNAAHLDTNLYPPAAQFTDPWGNGSDDVEFLMANTNRYSTTIGACLRNANETVAVASGDLDFGYHGFLGELALYPAIHSDRDVYWVTDNLRIKWIA